MHQPPREHGGPVTIDGSENIVMHDTIEDAIVHARLHEGYSVYESHFVPVFDMGEVQARHQAAVLAGLEADVGAHRS